jgi:exonuclease VII small subunit
MDEKIAKIEKLAKELETEKDFDKSIAKFTEAAELVKVALDEGAKQKGKVLEVIKEIDGIVERELKDEGEE